MATVEDAWSGNPSDAKSSQSPSDGSTLTWTGETLSERVMPKAPEGKAWLGGELIRLRKGSRRAPDVHPLQWWLMSTGARLNAQDAWKVKYGEIRQAQNRRSIPREELAQMPKPLALSAAIARREPAEVPALFLK